MVREALGLLYAKSMANRRCRRRALHDPELLQALQCYSLRKTDLVSNGDPFWGPAVMPVLRHVICICCGTRLIRRVLHDETNGAISSELRIEFFGKEEGLRESRGLESIVRADAFSSRQTQRFVSIMKLCTKLWLYLTFFKTVHLNPCISNLGCNHLKALRRFCSCIP